VQEAAKHVFQQKHHTGGKENVRVISESFRFYRMMQLRDIYFVGGFGTMQWINIHEYASMSPDNIVLFHPHETIDMLSAKFGDMLARVFWEKELEGQGDSGDAAVISIDARGIDVRVRHEWECTMHRLTFDALVQTPDEALRAVDRALAEMQAA
jgi:hypothetical protein